MIFAALIFAGLAACASGPGPDGVNDPYEGTNRKVHAFNRGLDQHVVKPLTSGMSGGGDKAPDARLGVARTVVHGVGNFGDNLALPGKVVNHLLQGKPEPALKNSLRFMVNSTLGMAGILDPAGADFALPEQDTDFGQTLAVWGVPEGAYLELPLLGPSTSRDTAGDVVDLVIDPMGYVLDRWIWAAGIGARLVSKAGDRAQYSDSVDSILYESADSYAQTRLIWLQHRRHELGEQGDDIDPYAE